jgi:hypothetical protein
MVADDKTRLYNDIIETVIQLTSTNTQQICRFYNVSVHILEKIKVMVINATFNNISVL